MAKKTVAQIRRDAAVQGAWALMEHLGLDPEEPRFDGDPRRTPERMVHAYEEMCATSYDQLEPPRLAVFEAERGLDAMVTVKAIPFVSVCEHHLLPFMGVVDFGYIPRDHVLGLSKVPRVVEYFSRQPQMQERICSQIANFILKEVQCLGVGCRITARHSCMELRGVRALGSVTVTDTLLGSFKDPFVRSEFFHNIGSAVQP